MAVTKVCAGFVVMASVATDKGVSVRRVSRLYTIEDAASEFVRLAKPVYPDAYLHRVMKTVRGRRKVAIDAPPEQPASAAQAVPR